MAATAERIETFGCARAVPALECELAILKWEQARFVVDLAANQKKADVGCAMRYRLSELP